MTIEIVHLPQPYLLFLGDATDATDAPDAKTAFGLREWAPDRCIGEYSLPSALVTTGLPQLTPAQAYARGARAMVIGVAPYGGIIAAAWVPALLEALQAGLDLISGMHARLEDFSVLKLASEQLGRSLIDVRVPRRKFAVATGKKRSGRRLLTVGTDCALGKKYTALALTRAFKARGCAADFRATGQTGIMIAGEGVPIDAVVADFIAGGRSVEPGCSRGALGCRRGPGFALSSFLRRRFARASARHASRRDRHVPRARARSRAWVALVPRTERAGSRGPQSDACAAYQPRRDLRRGELQYIEVFGAAGTRFSGAGKRAARSALRRSDSWRT